MTDVASLVGPPLVAAVVLGGLVFVVGWTVCRLLVVPAPAEVAMRRLQWLRLVERIPLVFIGCASFFASLAALEPLSEGLVVVVGLGAVGFVVGIAAVAPLIHLGLLELTSYGGARWAVFSAGLYGLGICSGPGLGIVIARTVSYAAIPIAVAATLAYFALGPWLTDRLNETEPVPPALARRWDELAAATTVPVRFRVLVDEDTPTAIASGIPPGTRTVYVSESLTRDLEPTELDAAIAHELGHLQHRHSEKRALGIGVAAASFMAGPLFESLLLLLASALVLFALGAWAIRFEYEADAFAAEITDADAIASALDRIVSLRNIPRDTSRVFDYLMDHPSVARRTDRLAETSK